MQSKINELQNEAIAAATDHIREQRKKNENTRIIAYCLAILIGIAMICGTILACIAIIEQQNTIREQQYALNMQYAGLLDYISGAEITTSEYTAQADGDGSISVAGDGNITAGGDINGE